MKEYKKKDRLLQTIEPPKKPLTGETVEQFLKRGGQIKKLEPGIVDGAVAFTKKWPGGKP